MSFTLVRNDTETITKGGSFHAECLPLLSYLFLILYNIKGFRGGRSFEFINVHFYLTWFQSLTIKFWRAVLAWRRAIIKNVCASSKTRQNYVRKLVKKSIWGYLHGSAPGHCWSIDSIHFRSLLRSLICVTRLEDHCLRNECSKCPACRTGARWSCQCVWRGSPRCGDASSSPHAPGSFLPP